MIDNCGNKVHSWQTPYQPGLTGYLLENGNLLRAARTNTNIDFNAGGAAGKVELLLPLLAELNQHPVGAFGVEEYYQFIVCAGLRAFVENRKALRF